MDEGKQKERCEMVLTGNEHKMYTKMKCNVTIDRTPLNRGNYVILVTFVILVGPDEGQYSME